MLAILFYQTVGCTNYGLSRTVILLKLKESGTFIELRKLQYIVNIRTEVGPGAPVMQEEIFGPILPVLTFESLDEAETFITDRPTPLALYIFSQDREVQQRFVRYVPFGGGCVNDTIMHLATSHMGFGGMGASGMGQYHGRESFDTFSHKKSIVNKATWLDVPFRYAPYASWKHKFVRMFVH